MCSFQGKWRRCSFGCLFTCRSVQWPARLTESEKNEKKTHSAKVIDVFIFNQFFVHSHPRHIVNGLTLVLHIFICSALPFQWFFQFYFYSFSFPSRRATSIYHTFGSLRLVLVRQVCSVHMDQIKDRKQSPYVGAECVKLHSIDIKSKTTTWKSRR